MRTVRRLYFYLVTFITLEVVLWGVILLLRSIFSPEIGGGGNALASSLALILVGVPIFALHWLWAQRISAADLEEHASTLRAVFLYGVLLATLIPVVQNILAFLDRTFISLARLDTYRAVVGGGQSWTDNLIAIALNGIAAMYFITVLRHDWATLVNKDNYADIRRLYRYIWHLYGLLMSVFGVQQVIRFLLYVPSETLGQISRDLFLNGLSLLLVGVPIWFFSWRTCQAAKLEPGEHDSGLRFGVLYLLSFAGVAVVLSAAGILLDVFLRWALGEVMPLTEFLRNVTGAISLGIPFATVWAYYSRWFQHDVKSVPDEHRRDGLLRFYNYIIAFAGLVTSFVGLAMLLSFIIDVVIGRQIWGMDLRRHISAALATLLVGLPLWYTTWRPLQSQALAQGSAGGFARRSMVRKVYLYLALFAGVIGGMVAAVNVVYRLLQSWLGAATLDLTGLLNMLQLLVLFAILLVYHLTCLRVDGSDATRALIERHEKLKAVVFESAGSGFGESIRLAVEKQVQGLRVTVLTAEAEMPEDATSARVAVIPSNLAVYPPASLHKFLTDFAGQVIVVPVADAKWLWLNNDNKSADQAALVLRQLSEGQVVKFGGTSAFMVLVYIFAALFGLQLLLLLLSLGISLVVG